MTEYFEDRIEPVRTKPLYWLALMVVAVIVLILPLIYLALIGVVGWLAFLHATENLDLITTHGTGGIFWRIIIYIAPLIGGAILILFMFKPFFARRLQQANPYTLEREQEPELFAFVDAIAGVIGAPAPACIQIDCLPNASASYHKGIVGMLQGDLTLTIGTPLLTAMNTRQMAGVIAHELGHFTQSGGMLGSYIIRSISQWFEQYVYQRDAWDAWLVRVTNDSGCAIVLIMLFTRMGVFVSRCMMLILMVLAHGISCFLLRQMEYDADLHEIRLAGTSTFTSTSNRLQLANVAFTQFLSEIDSLEAAGRLPDNVPRMLANRIDHLARHVDSNRTPESAPLRAGIFDTHPSEVQRTARAEVEQAPGVFRLEKPCSVLFRQFDVICKWSTLGLYQVVYEDRVHADQLVPVQSVIENDKLQHAGLDAETRYFQGLLHPNHLLAISRRDVRSDLEPAKIVSALRTARKRLVEARDAQQHVAKLIRAENRIHQLNVAREYANAGVRIDRASFNLPKSDRDSIDAAVVQARAHRQICLDAVAQIDALLARRLTLSLSLLHTERAESAFKNVLRLRSHTMSLVAAIEHLLENRDHIQDIVSSMIALGHLFELGLDESDQKCRATVDRLIDRLRDGLLNTRAALVDIDYPLEHGKEKLTLSRYLIPKPVADAHTDLQAVYTQGANVMDRLPQLYGQLYGRLALVAEKVESAAGLDPLNKPKHTAEDLASSTDHDQS